MLDNILCQRLKQAEEHISIMDGFVLMRDHKEECLHNLDSISLVQLFLTQQFPYQQRALFVLHLTTEDLLLENYHMKSKQNQRPR